MPKRKRTKQRTFRARVQLISKRYQQFRRFDKLMVEVRDQLIDAEMALRDIQAQRKKAWKKYKEALGL